MSARENIHKFLNRLITLLVFALVFVVTIIVVMLVRTGQLDVLFDALSGKTTYKQAAKELSKEAKGSLFSLKIIPQEGRAVDPATIKFKFEGRTYKVKGAVDARVYNGAVAARRSYVTTFYKSEAQKRSEYMQALVDDPAQKPAIEALCKAFRAVRDKRKFTSDEYAEFITKYVQSIPYDYDRAAANENDETQAGDPRFPVQVIVDGRGDCDEKVYLLAALLKHEGYGCAGFLFIDEKHMSLGISSQGEGFRGTGYEFVETTSPSYISEEAHQYANGVELYSAPEIVNFSEGAPYSREAVDEVAAIVNARDSALDAAPEAKAKAESARTESAFNRYKTMYEDCYEARNTLQVTVDEKGKRIDEFKDRKDAYAWIQARAWWVK